MRAYIGPAKNLPLNDRETPSKTEDTVLLAGVFRFSGKRGIWEELGGFIYAFAEITDENELGKWTPLVAGPFPADNISSIRRKSSRFLYIPIKKRRKAKRLQKKHARSHPQPAHESHSGENTIRPVKKCYATQFKMILSSSGF